MDTIPAFSSQIRALFPIFEKGQERPPPPLVTRPNPSFQGVNRLSVLSFENNDSRTS